MVQRGHSASALAEKGESARVSAERTNISLHPMKGLPLVPQALIAGCGGQHVLHFVAVSVPVQTKKGHHVQSLVQGGEDDAPVEEVAGAVDSPVTRAVGEEAPSADEHHDRQKRCVSGFRHVNV